MTTLKAIFEAFVQGDELVDFETIDELKLNMVVYDTVADEEEGTAKVVIKVEGIVTQPLKNNVHSSKSYKVYNITIEKAVLHGVSYTYSELIEKYGEMCLGDDAHIFQEVRDELTSKYKSNRIVVSIKDAAITNHN